MAELTFSEFQKYLEQYIPCPVKILSLKDLVVQESSDNSSSNDAKCPFDCCNKKLEKLYFSECEVTNTKFKMRIGIDNNKGRLNNGGGQYPPMKRTLFEGKVPGPMRFDDLLKGEGEDSSKGDQEILLMERDNLKLTFHKGSQLSSCPPPPQYYQHQHQHHLPQTITDGEENWIQNFNKDSPGNKGRNNNIPQAVWCSGQMEVTQTKNVYSHEDNQQQQRYNAECKIPVMEMSRNEAKSEFIDQQLNNHLKGFKYVKPQSQQHYSSPQQRHNNGPTASATITKIPYIPSYQELSNNKNSSSLSGLNSKSKPNFKQKNNSNNNNSAQKHSKAALEQYEKLRKYWEYQNQYFGNQQQQLVEAEHQQQRQQQQQHVYNMPYPGGNKSHLVINTYHQPNPQHSTSYQHSLSQQQQQYYDTARYNNNNQHHQQSFAPQRSAPLPPNKDRLASLTEIEKLYKNQQPDFFSMGQVIYPQSKGAPYPPQNTPQRKDNFEENRQSQKTWHSMPIIVPEKEDPNNLSHKITNILENPKQPLENTEMEILKCENPFKPAAESAAGALKEPLKDLEEAPTDLSLPRRRSEQDQRMMMPSQGSLDVTGYDHIVLLDKRVMTYMCKRCLETLKSEQDIRNHLFCKMLQNSIQCHVCRNLLATDEYPEHLRGHGVRAISN